MATRGRARAGRERDLPAPGPPGLTVLFEDQQAADQDLQHLCAHHSRGAQVARALLLQGAGVAHGEDQGGGLHHQHTQGQVLYPGGLTRCNHGPRGSAGGRGRRRLCGVRGDKGYLWVDKRARARGRERNVNVR